MLLAAYASSKEVIYITTTHIQKSSLDCEASNFRELNHIYTRKNQIVIITSIIPRLHEGKLSLTTTPGSRFYLTTILEDIFINTLFINNQKTILALSLSLSRVPLFFLSLSRDLFSSSLPLIHRRSTISLSRYFFFLSASDSPEIHHLSHSTGSLRFTLSTPTSFPEVVFKLI
ncbi:hypothetical protein IGI04_019319 [Brassica rapa subsp. trilocularis]|uniref:Uncharacterized protein n=1 Tax=Brassica rapa subsp. trilocularis TaxID=1813537 RepID=A0ABQ7MGD2_BRACM|nr:hypothetical protein IGI04_019319 [Brassica rapa subsp. trilocularis]